MRQVFYLSNQTRYTCRMRMHYMYMYMYMYMRLNGVIQISEAVLPMSAIKCQAQSSHHKYMNIPLLNSFQLLSYVLFMHSTRTTYNYPIFNIFPFRAVELFIRFPSLSTNIVPSTTSFSSLYHFHFTC